MSVDPQTAGPATLVTLDENGRATVTSHATLHLAICAGERWSDAHNDDPSWMTRLSKESQE